MVFWCRCSTCADGPFSGAFGAGELLVQLVILVQAAFLVQMNLYLHVIILLQVAFLVQVSYWCR